ncbi:hypothetical protein ZIOFF_063823 [Zingiber officinale]|uniref:Uncharacterized protein n=1 Tax=Zingiber officinale TaxID=94328 RepID=A0A8J5F701_ZINOF|nr:hypothetical protein ZIOFF_063823 [Zingiber officinale]
MMGTLTKTLLSESLPYPLPQKNSHLKNSFKILLHEEDTHGVNIARNQDTIRTIAEICIANQQIGSLRESMTIEVILLLLMRQNHLPSLRNKWMVSGKSSSLKSLPLQSKSLQQPLKVLKLRANIADFSCDLTNTTETLNDLHCSACQLASKTVNYESGFKTLLLTNMESGRRMISMGTRCLNYRDKEDSLLDVLRGCNIVSNLWASLDRNLDEFYRLYSLCGFSSDSLSIPVYLDKGQKEEGQSEGRIECHPYPPISPLPHCPAYLTHRFPSLNLDLVASLPSPHLEPVAQMEA